MAALAGGLFLLGLLLRGAATINSFSARTTHTGAPFYVEPKRPKLSGDPEKDASILLGCGYENAVLQLRDENALQQNIKLFKAILGTQEHALSVPFFKEVERDTRLPKGIRRKARQCLGFLESSQAQNGQDQDAQQ